jgi:hypothetical protein
MLLVVRLSSERARPGLRQDCSLGKKQESCSVLLVVVEAVAPGLTPTRPLASEGVGGSVFV